MRAKHIFTFITIGILAMVVMAGCSGSSKSSGSKPAAPTGLVATPADSQITLQWNASKGAISYTIYQSTTSGGLYTKTNTATSTDFVVTGLTNGTKYYFVVTSVNGAGESGYSNEANATPQPAITKPSPPTNLTAIAGDQQVSLTWNASTGATSYNVYQSSASGGPYTGIVSSVTSLNYTVTGLTNGLSYYFVVTAINAGGESGYSNQAGVTLISGPPTNLTAIPGNAMASLTWNTTIGATSYKVYYSTVTGGPYSAVGTTTTASYTVAALTNSITYYFVVTSVNSGGESGYSNEASATPQLTDIDGNVYDTVTIGTQVWMVENLKTTRYNDGTSIPNVTDTTTWSNSTTGAYCDYNNDPSNSTIYGRLYNWYAASDPRICPTGWHVPSDAEWTTLTTYLGGESVAGGALKEAGTVHWASPNTGATNSSGFTALPGGYRDYAGTFYLIGYFGYWWSATDDLAPSAWYRYMYYNTSNVYRGSSGKVDGFSLRCVRD